MTCCTAHRSHPALFIAIAALSALAFVGQALAAPAAGDATAFALATAR